MSQATSDTTTETPRSSVSSQSGSQTTTFGTTTFSTGSTTMTEKVQFQNDELQLRVSMMAQEIRELRAQIFNSSSNTKKVMNDYLLFAYALPLRGTMFNTGFFNIDQIRNKEVRVSFPQVYERQPEVFLYRFGEFKTGNITDGINVCFRVVSVLFSPGTRAI